jgi:rhamnose utilization protein RhaD (predicted bifunctional aldolase and dehydrogenase)
MLDRWNQHEAAQYAGDLETCAYVSRLLGADPALVLYGGGNTSVKTRQGAEDVLYVKGSGADLARAEPQHFTPVRLEQVQALVDADQLTNDELASAVAQCVLVSSAPRASIETLLHALLPHKFVLHTHADSILAVTNTEHGAKLAADIFARRAPLVPFRASGFALAKAAHEVYRAQATSETIGLILLHHGVFSFGATAHAAYRNMQELVQCAERYLQERGAWALETCAAPSSWEPTEIAHLRRTLSHIAGFPLVLQLQETPELRAFALDARAPVWWEQGPATPQHAVFVKRKPLFGRDAEGYAREYMSELQRYRPIDDVAQLGLDPSPRVVVDREWGTWTASIDAAHAAMTGEIYRHDIEIISRASRHDRYLGLPRSAIIDAEIHYGGFERKARAGYSRHACLLGEVALVASGAAAGATASALKACGAEVAIPGTSSGQDGALPLEAGDASARTTLRALVSQVGGLDVLVIGPGSETWVSECIDLLKLSPRGGRIILQGPETWCARLRTSMAELNAPGLQVVDLPTVSERALQSVCEQISQANGEEQDSV